MPDHFVQDDRLRALDSALECGFRSSKRAFLSLRALWVETPVEVRLLSAASRAGVAKYLGASDGETRRRGGAAEVTVPGDHDQFLLAEREGSGQVDRVVAPEPE
jgi:hypothetical protein